MIRKSLRGPRRLNLFTPFRHELTGDEHTDAMAREALIHKRTAQLRALAGLLIIAMGIATFGSLYILVKTAAENHDGVVRLVDCTTPGGTCFKELRDPTNNGAVDYIKEVTILASVCSKIPGNDTVAQVRTCVESELAKG